MSSLERIMLFRTGGKTLGIPISFVRRALEEEEVTPLPRYPSEVVGAILFEGKAVPVFGPPTGAKRNTKKKYMILIVLHDSGPMGIVIDEVVKIVEAGPGWNAAVKGVSILDGVEFEAVTPDDLAPESVRVSR